MNTSKVDCLQTHTDNKHKNLVMMKSIHQCLLQSQKNIMQHTYYKGLEQTNGCFVTTKVPFQSNF